MTVAVRRWPRWRKLERRELIGLVWASICWLVAQRCEPITQVKAERDKPAAS